MPKLYQPKKKEDLNSNDPVMINPRGMSIKVPEERVIELLKKGFILEDRNWRPTPKEDERFKRRDPEPLPIKELENNLNRLQVTEV